MGGNPLSYTDPMGLINLVGQVSGTAIVGSIGGTAGAGVYITLPSPGNNFDIRVFGAAGPAVAAGNDGFSQQVGLVTGSESDIQGLSYNVEGDVPPVGLTAVFDADKNWVGGMGPAEELGAASIQHTKAVGLNDFGEWLGGLIYDHLHPYNPNCQ